MKLSTLYPGSLTLTLTLPLLASALLQSTRTPRPDEFEPFRLHIGADSVPDFVSSRTNPYEISSHSQAGPGIYDDSRGSDERAIAATVDIIIDRVDVYAEDSYGTGPQNQPFSDVIGTPSLGDEGGRRTQKAIVGIYHFDPPMDIVDLMVDGGPSGLVKTDCYILMKKKGQFVKFGLGVWTSAADAVSVYCAGYYPIENESL